MATFKEAVAIQDQTVARADLWAAGMNSVGVTRAKDKNGFAVKISFEHGPIPDLPTEIDGIPIYAEIGGPIKFL